MNWERRKSATGLAASRRRLGASRATCSISSLKLTAVTLDEFLAENLANDATHKPFEGRVRQESKRPYRILLVRLEEILGLAQRTAFGDDAAHAIPAFRGARPNYRGDQVLVSAVGALVRDGKDQRQANAVQVVGVGFAPEVLEVVLDLVGDAERFTVFAQDVVRLCVGAPQDCAQPQRYLERGRRFLTEDVQDLDGGERLRVPCPQQLAALAAAESRNISGKELVASVVAGYECSARVLDSMDYTEEASQDVNGETISVFAAAGGAGRATVRDDGAGPGGGVGGAAAGHRASGGARFENEGWGVGRIAGWDKDNIIYTSGVLQNNNDILDYNSSDLLLFKSFL